MADKGKRALSASANAPSKVTADAKTFSARLQKITGEFESLCKDTEGLKEYGKLADKQAALKKELDEKDETIRSLKEEVENINTQKEQEIARLQAETLETRRYHNRLTEEYNAKFKAWDADRSLHETDGAELTRLKEELEAVRTSAKATERENRISRDKLTKQAKQLQEEQARFTIMKDERQIKELQLKRSQTELETCRKTLTTLKDNLGIIPSDKEKTRQRLEDLAMRSQKLAQLHFARDIADPNSTKTPISVASLGRIPQVASNSAAALATRCALAEAIIAQELERRIFKAFFIPEDAGGTEIGGFNKALTWLDKRRPLEATIIRCQLARACYELDGAKAIPIQAATNVSATLDSWLDDDQARRLLEEGLISLFSEAVDVWKDIQRTRKHITVKMELTADWFEDEDKRPEYDSIALGEEHRSQQLTSQVTGPVAVLFPQILAGDDLLFHGYALFPTQSAIIAAVQERNNQSTPNANHRRRSIFKAGQRRRSSVVGDGLQLGTSSDVSYSERASQQ